MTLVCNTTEAGYVASLAEPTPQAHWLERLDGAQRFHRWVASRIGPLPGPGLLEVGCGIGTYTGFWAAMGHHVTAIDIDARFVDQAGRRFADRAEIEVRLEDVTEPSPEDERWQSAVMLDVLEHLEHDVDVLKGLAARLVPGGWLAIKVPAHEWLRGSLDDAVDHYRRYSKRSLARACDKAGFEVMRMEPFNALAVPGWWWNAKVRRVEVAPAYQVSAFDKLVPLGRLVDMVNPFFFGASLIAVVRRTS